MPITGSNGTSDPPKVSSSLLVALLVALGAAGLIGAGVANNPTTTPGDLIVRGDAGVLARLGTSGATDGGVLTVAGGAVQWAAASGGGTHGAGTLASRPASPAAGDTYEVTSGAALHDRYECFAAGTWTIVSYDRIREDETPYLWWRLTEASGNAASSGSASSATLTATSISAYNVPLAGGAPRGARFDGSASQFSGASTATGISTAWTLAAWVTYRDTSLNYRTIVGLDTATGSFGQPYASAALAINNSGAVRAWITTTSQTGTGQEVSGGTTLVTDGMPHHLVARFTGSALQVVIDGVQRASTTPTGGTTFIGASPAWSIGVNDGNERWLGAISDVRVYTTAKDDAWCLETWARGVGVYAGQ